MAFCTSLSFRSVLSWGKALYIFTDPCAHQQFWCGSPGTIWWVHVILQSWADWQQLQNLHVRKWGFMAREGELAGFLALEISIKGVCFVPKIWSQLPQSAIGTCCNTHVLAKQPVGGWWWKFRAVFKALHVQPISFVNMPEVSGPKCEFPGCTWISVKHTCSLFAFLRKAPLLVLLFHLAGSWTSTGKVRARIWKGVGLYMFG